MVETVKYCGSSALCVLGLQPVIVDINDRKEVRFHQILYEVLPFESVSVDFTRL